MMSNTTFTFTFASNNNMNNNYDGLFPIEDVMNFDPVPDRFVHFASNVEVIEIPKDDANKAARVFGGNASYFNTLAASNRAYVESVNGSYAFKAMIDDIESSHDGAPVVPHPDEYAPPPAPKKSRKAVINAADEEDGVAPKTLFPTTTSGGSLIFWDCLWDDDSDSDDDDDSVTAKKLEDWTAECASDGLDYAPNAIIGICVAVDIEELAAVDIGEFDDDDDFFHDDSASYVPDDGDSLAFSESTDTMDSASSVHDDDDSLAFSESTDTMDDDEESSVVSESSAIEFDLSLLAEEDNDFDSDSDSDEESSSASYYFLDHVDDEEATESVTSDSSVGEAVTMDDDAEFALADGAEVDVPVEEVAVEVPMVEETPITPLRRSARVAAMEKSKPASRTRNFLSRRAKMDSTMPGFYTY